MSSEEEDYGFTQTGSKRIGIKKSVKPGNKISGIKKSVKPGNKISGPKTLDDFSSENESPSSGAGGNSSSSDDSLFRPPQLKRPVPRPRQSQRPDIWNNRSLVDDQDSDSEKLQSLQIVPLPVNVSTEPSDNSENDKDTTEELIDLIENKLRVTRLSEVNSTPLYKRNPILPWTYDIQNQVDGYVVMGFLAGAPRRVINCLRRRCEVDRVDVTSHDLSDFIGEMESFSDAISAVRNLLMVSANCNVPNVVDFFIEHEDRPPIFNTSVLETEDFEFVKGDYTHVIFAYVENFDDSYKVATCDTNLIPDSFGYCYKGKELYDAIDSKTLPPELDTSVRLYLTEPRYTMRFELCWLLLNKSDAFETSSCFLVVRKGENEFYMMENGTCQLIGDLTILHKYKVVYACYGLV